MVMTKHGMRRQQQRGVPPAIIEWLQQFGAVAYTNAAKKRFFDRAARKRMAQALGHQVVDRLGDLLNCYVVESLDGTIITTGHHTERIRKH